MAQVKIKLPTMHPAQQHCRDNAKRFNIVAAGNEWGRTTLGIDVLLASKDGALSSKRPVAWFSATKEDMVLARRKVINLVEPLVKRRASSRRLELTTGGAIDFFSLEDGPEEVFDGYGLVVIDDAKIIKGLLDFWEDVITPMLLQHKGTAWLLSGAYGKKNDFYRLWSLAARDANWARFQFSALDSPYADTEKLAALSGDEYRQDVLAEFLEQAHISADYRKLIQLPELHPAQQRIFAESRRYNVAVCGRRFGKTFLSAEVLIDGPRKKGAIHGFPVALYAPTYAIMLESWRTLSNLLAPITLKKSEQNKRIDLVTGGSLELWSLDNPDAGRGRKYSVVVIDEAAMILRLEEAFTQNIQPLLLDYQGEAWMLSTPKGDNYFKRMFDLGSPANPQQDPGWMAWQLPTWENPHISKDDIEDMRRTMPRLAFLQEIEAQFVSFAGTFIKAEHIQTGQPPAGMRLYQGVDLAISMKETADYTAIVTIGIDDHGRVWIVDAERRRVGFHDGLEFIKQKAARWNPDQIGVEVVQFQAAVVETLLRSTTLPVRKIRPDKDKLTRAQSLITRYENGLVYHSDQLPQDFTNELLSFGPDCEHDDFVDAAVYAYSMASGYGRSQIMVPPDRQPQSKVDIQKVLEQFAPSLGAVMDDAQLAMVNDSCGSCASFEDGQCSERLMAVKESSPGCIAFMRAA